MSGAGSPAKKRTEEVGPAASSSAVSASNRRSVLKEQVPAATSLLHALLIVLTLYWHGPLGRLPVSDLLSHHDG